jgi:hypothetical protein
MNTFYDQVAALNDWAYQGAGYGYGYRAARDACEDIAIAADSEIARLNAIIAEYEKNK